MHYCRHVGSPMMWSIVATSNSDSKFLVAHQHMDVFFTEPCWGPAVFGLFCILDDGRLT